jgi:predicted ATPase/class 3 adenylate cyclase
MNNLPTGTITFLFTDIEGSTRLFQEHPDAMKDALVRHHAILQHAIESHDGYVFQIIGDAFCAAFATAPDALIAALAAQRALHDEDWNETGPLRVRMGLHTGTAQVHVEDTKAGQYSGYSTLARTQRIMSAGHGGQVLVSSATAELVRGQLPEGISLRGLGEHRLKGIVNPEHLWQMVTPDLPAEFPPLQSLNTIPNNLPLQLTSFIGREHDLAEIRRLLGAARLVTLTGPGGVGKTRLSLQFAAEVLDEFPNGVWFVEFAPISDPALIPQLIASALGVREEAARLLIDILSDYFRAKTALLILDNCEHLIADSAAVADRLLHAAPELRIVASSREAMGIGGETTYLVPSLALPDANHLPPLETLTQYEAVRLFIDRATAAQTSFSVTNVNAPAIAQICHRLDGIPLAIELASARVRSLPVEQIARRLDNRFRLLTGGSRTALPRQQTLQATIDWSYSLLSDEERLLFRRLSVFAGGWTLEAAEEICADKEEGGRTPALAASASGSDELHPSSLLLHPSDVLDVLARLVDKSLVLLKDEDGAGRYGVLETIRQYAQDKLSESGEADQVRNQHLSFFLRLAETAEPELWKAEQKHWYDRLERELDNMRAALDWSANREEADPVLRLAAALYWFWWVRGYMNEGLKWLEWGLARESSVAARARALPVAAFIVNFLGDTKRGMTLAKEGVALSRTIDDKVNLAFSTLVLGQGAMWVGNIRQNIRQAETCYEESLSLFREAGPAGKLGILLALFNLANVAFVRDDYQQAVALFEECLVVLQDLGDKLFAAQVLGNLGRVANTQGNYGRAAKLFKESLTRSRELDQRPVLAGVLGSLGIMAGECGDYERAATLLEESLALLREQGSKVAVSYALGNLASVVWRQGDTAQAVQLLDECLSLQKEIGEEHNPYTQRIVGDLARAQGDYERATALYRDSLLHQIKEDRWGNTESLRRLATIAGVQGQPERAARLFAAAETIRNAIGAVLPPVDRPDNERDVAAVRAQLDEAAFASAWAEGCAMRLEQAVAYALSDQA